VATGKRRQRQISGPKGSAMPRLQFTGIISVIPIVDVTLRRSDAAIGASSMLPTGEFCRELPPDQKPDPERGIEPAGNEKDRPFADKA